MTHAGVTALGRFHGPSTSTRDANTVQSAVALQPRAQASAASKAASLPAFVNGYRRAPFRTEVGVPLRATRVQRRLSASGWTPPTRASFMRSVLKRASRSRSTSGGWTRGGRGLRGVVQAERRIADHRHTPTGSSSGRSTT